MTVPILSEYSASNLAIANVDEMIRNIEEEIGKGTPQHYAAYQFEVGRIRGLREAKRELLDALAKIEV